jgi:conjugal transfer pilus assembly protein TraB
MDWKNPFRKGPKALDGPAAETGSRRCLAAWRCDRRQRGGQEEADAAARRRRARRADHRLVVDLRRREQEQRCNVKRQVADVSVDEMVNKNMAEKEWRAQSEAQMMSMDNNMRALAARAQRADQLEAQLAQSQAQAEHGGGGFRPTPNGCFRPTRTKTSS